MGAIRGFRPARLFFAVLEAGGVDRGEAERALEERFGRIDYRSRDLPFRYTDYYAEEMGPEIVRRFLSVEPLFDPSGLAEAKLFTNALEDRFRRGGRRRLNLDPGFLDESKVVLASTKDNAQRVPLREGVYAEVTLLFDAKLGAYAPLRWTYPDFASGDYREVLLELRARLRRKLGT